MYVCKLEMYKGTEQIGRHFTTNGHKGLEDVTLYIISVIKQPRDTPQAQLARDNLELAWIHRMCSQAPYGPNVLE